MQYLTTYRMHLLVCKPHRISTTRLQQQQYWRESYCCRQTYIIVIIIVLLQDMLNNVSVHWITTKQARPADEMRWSNEFVSISKLIKLPAALRVLKKASESLNWFERSLESSHCQFSSEQVKDQFNGTVGQARRAGLRRWLQNKRNNFGPDLLSAPVSWD